MPDTLLTTKINIPSSGQDLIRRQRLINQLNDGLDRKLVLISAPAGFGKTTLVNNWAKLLRKNASNKKLKQYDVAWFSVEESDNDPGRFLTYLISALQTIDSSIGKKSQAVFHSQQQFLIEPILTSLVNDLAYLATAQNSKREIILILDDYHSIEDPRIHHVTEFILDHLPPHVHIVISTRIDPPLPLSRLRARNQMVEIRGTNLHFTKNEAEEFFNEIMELDLTSEEIAMIESRTEGWVAGLQLAGLSIRGHENRKEFIRAFSGDNRLIIDYLVDEVLMHESDDIRRFIHRTSILDQMCSLLCDTVVNLSDDENTLDSQNILEYLDRNNLFIIPLDTQRKWFRYHHLFSEAVQNRYRGFEPEQLPILHSKASEWYEIQRDPYLALRHALAAKKLNRAVKLVEQNALDLLVNSQLARLAKWLKLLPMDLILSRPEISIYQTWLHLLTGTVEDASRFVELTDDLLSSNNTIEDTSRQEIQSHIFVQKARIALKKGELKKALKFADQALNYILERSPLHGHVAVIKGLCAFRAGDLEAADQRLQEAVSIAHDCNHKFMTVESAIWLGYIKTLQGHPSQAVSHYESALQLAELDEESKLPIAGSAYIGLALVEREKNNLDKAEEHLKEGYELCSLLGNLQAWHIAMSLVKSAQGKHEDALLKLQAAEKMEPGSEVPFADLNIQLVKIRNQITPSNKNLIEVLRWFELNRIKADDKFSFSQRLEYKLYARALITQGKLEEASKLLGRLRDNAKTEGRAGELIGIFVLLAICSQAQRDEKEAHTALDKALDLGKAEGYIRSFVDEGQAIRRLLNQISTEDIQKKLYIREILESFKATQNARALQSSQSLIEPLTSREIEVLNLMSEGLTNREIANRLFLSPNTIKVHSHNIFGKLGVKNRTEATSRAKDLGILPY